MTIVLGISAFFHDSAAAIVVDGEVVAAAQEERFSRIKHDASFPAQAIEFCLSAANVTIQQLDHVVFYEKPFLKFERILETHVRFAPKGWNAFCQSMPVWLKSKLYLSRTIRKGLKHKYRRRIVFPEHHESHAASAFFPSPFEEAAIITADGVGEWATTSFGVGCRNAIELKQEMRFPDSLGLLYSTFTAFCGFRVNGGEGKLMGLAAYGEPIYVDQILNELIDLRADGSFRLNQRFFRYCHSAKDMTSSHFSDAFGGPPRVPESEITKREQDLAASIQSVAELILLRMAKHVHAETGQRNLCLAGGVALNCVANSRLRLEGPFENVWVQPAAGDAGGAVGAALFVWHQLLGGGRRPKVFSTPYLGPGADFYLPNNRELRRIDTSSTIDQTDFDSSETLVNSVAQLLNSGKMVGWFQAQMEFGPRALGNRSILANPTIPGMQDRLNAKVKFREEFRPFAPIVLAERAKDYFEFPDESPYMLFAAKVRQPKSIPAATHVDGTARLQTVSREQNPILYQLLHAFGNLSGCPVLINTSFNVRGEPIVCSQEDAMRCFLSTELDAIVVGNSLYQKPENFRSKRGDSNASRTVQPQTNWWQRLRRSIDIATLPIRWMVSRLVLSATFLFVVCPISLVLRVSSKRRQEVSNESYWVAKTRGDDPDRYFKQY